MYLFIAALIMLPVAFFVPAAAYLLSKVKTTRPRDPPARRTLLHRCISVMLAYMMLIGPFGLRCLADWSVQYSQLTAGNWGQGNRTIYYGYDDNGSLIEKKTTVTSSEEILETVSYQYNLQNRLSAVTTSYTEDTNDVNEVTEYTYNDNGIRVKSYYYKTINDGDPEDEETKLFLIDSYNHTGYAQVLEEWSPSGSHPDVTYTIGDDVITQSDYDGPNPGDYTNRHLLYDGHGSTRQLTGDSGEVIEAYSYDAYGTMLGGNPSRANSTATNLLYCGEYFDTDHQQYYLRARWYDTSTGRFNRPDPFSGNTQDPQSLHKYLYCHANPINAIDPSGNMLLVSTLLSILSAVSIGITVVSFVLKGVQLGMGFKQLSVLADFMNELRRAPFPDLITKLRVRNVVGLIAIDTIRSTVGLGLEIIRDGIYILAFSILLRATLGFLRSLKHARALARAAKSRGPITDPSRLLPSAKMHKHHIFSKEFAQFWKKAGIKAKEYTVEIEQVTHLRGVHGKGMCKLPGRWNGIWDDFLRNNPKPSPLQIFQQAGKMMDEFGLSDLKIIPY